MPKADRIKPQRAWREGRARRMLAAIAALTLLAVLAIAVGDRFMLSTDSVKQAQNRSDRALPTQIYYGPPNSLAVLPFRMDDEVALEADRFLARGLAESLISELVQYTGLQVTAAGSSLFFPAGSVELPVMAERLKVSHLLTGSIRRSGDRLSVTVRLFRVKSDRDLWSDTFTTALSELPATRDRIIGAVLSAMNLTASKDAAREAVRPEAWLLLMQAQYFLQRHVSRDLARAETLFKQALELEPEYAAAWLGLAQTFLDPARPPPESRPGHELAREAALKALEFAPELAEAQVVLSRIKRNFDWDWPGARLAAQTALELRPGSADVLSNASDSEFTFGNFERAIELLRAAINRDPIMLPLLLRLGLLYEFAADYEQSLIAYRQLLGLNPDYPAAHAYRSRIKLAQGKAESALKEAELEPDPFWSSYARTLALIALERYDEADSIQDRLTAEHAGDAAYQLAEIHAYRGDVEGAFHWLERAWQQRDGGMTEMLGNHFLVALEGDPRWDELLRRMDLSR